MLLCKLSIRLLLLLSWAFPRLCAWLGLQLQTAQERSHDHA
jgi:hypothetical protein